MCCLSPVLMKVDAEHNTGLFIVPNLKEAYDPSGYTYYVD